MFPHFFLTRMEAGLRNLLDLKEEFDFDRGIQRKGIHADSSTGMLPRFAEEILKKFARPIGNERLIGKAVSRLNEDADSYDAAHSSKVTIKVLLDDCKTIQDALHCGLLRLIDGNLSRDRTGCKQRFSSER